MLKQIAVSLRPSGLAIAAASLLLALPAQATVVLDTFGPGDTANGSNWSLFNDSPNSTSGQFLAVSFTLAEAAIVTDILTSIDGNGTYSVGIVAGAGLPSGAFSFSTVLNSPVANSAVTGLNWVLGAGSYWLVSRAEAGALGTWRGGEQPDNNWAFAFEASDANWTSAGNFDAPAARITVSAIPEPGTWAMMLGGLAVCGAVARRRRG